MPKRLVFIEVDQEGKPVEKQSPAWTRSFEDGYNSALRWLTDHPSASASEALVEEIAKVQSELDDPHEATCTYDAPCELCKSRARTLLSRVEETTP